MTSSNKGSQCSRPVYAVTNLAVGDPSTLTFDTPTFSTADAPYFLKHAVDIQRGESVDFFKVSRSYPNNPKTEQKLADRSDMRDYPLLSVVLAKLASNKDKSSLVAVGNLLLVLTAALTTAAITVCFGAAGYWAHGAVAGLGGGLSAAYLVRSSIGRIDTDQLNLGFMYLIFGLCRVSRTSTIAVFGVIAVSLPGWLLTCSCVVVANQN